MIELLNEIFDTLRTTDIPTLVDMLYKKGVGCNYDPPQSEDNRMIFYNTTKSKENIPNGLIIDYAKLEVLCMPPPKLTKTKELPEDITDYDLYELQDGTIINLYYYKNKWIVATAKSYQANELKWRNVTYNQMLEDLEFPYQTLDTSRCYTFGVAHQFVHFTAVNNLWFVSNWFDGKYNYVDPAIPVKPQNSLKHDVKDCELSYNPKDPFYGIIARSRDPNKGDFMIESKTMRHIRLLDYNNDFRSQAAQLGIKYDNYLLLQIVLNKKLTGIGCNLLPHYMNKIKNMIKKINIVAHDVANDKHRYSVKEYFKQHISNIVSVDKDKEHMVAEIIRSVQFLHIWHQYFLTQSI